MTIFFNFWSKYNLFISNTWLFLSDYNFTMILKFCYVLLEKNIRIESEKKKYVQVSNLLKTNITIILYWELRETEKLQTEYLKKFK